MEIWGYTHTAVDVEALLNKDRLGDQHQKDKRLSGQEEEGRSTSKASGEKNEEIGEVKKGRAAPRKRKEVVEEKRKGKWTSKEDWASLGHGGLLENGKVQAVQVACAAVAITSIQLSSTTVTVETDSEISVTYRIQGAGNQTMAGGSKLPQPGGPTLVCFVCAGLSFPCVSLCSCDHSHHGDSASSSAID
jgi:hypothetical protein